MSRKHRGVALTFVLLLIALLLAIVSAGALLLPLQTRALDEHYEYEACRALSDAALEEAAAHLDAGESPEFSRELSVGGEKGFAKTLQLGKSDRERELIITTRMPATQASRIDNLAREWNLTLRTTLLKSKQGWRVASVALLSAKIAAVSQK